MSASNEEDGRHTVASTLDSLTTNAQLPRSISLTPQGMPLNSDASHLRRGPSGAGVQAVDEDTWYTPRVVNSAVHRRTHSTGYIPGFCLLCGRDHNTPIVYSPLVVLQPQPQPQLQPQPQPQPLPLIQGAVFWRVLIFSWLVVALYLHTRMSVKV